MSGASAPRLHAVVLAGGAGTRFWPLSRQARPKPLLRLGDGESLLEATLERARHFAAAERLWLVCAREHAAAMREAAGLSEERTIVEPAARDTAMAVAVAAERIQAEDPEAVMVVLPADHSVPDAAAFASSIRSAAAAAAGEGALVTLGIRPTRPATDYGYIQLGRPADPPYAGLHRVRRFVEKPDRARARRYLKSGTYRWNAGVFVWGVRSILEEIERCAPELHAALKPLRELARDDRGRAEAVERAYADAPKLPVDRAVAERSRRLWCLPVDFHWSDVGTWQSLAEEHGVGRNVTHVMDGETLLRDAPGNLVCARDRPVVLLGVEGLAVVDAGDALLVARLDRSSEVRELVAELRARGRADLT